MQDRLGRSAEDARTLGTLVEINFQLRQFSYTPGQSGRDAGVAFLQQRAQAGLRSYLVQRIAAQSTSILSLKQFHAGPEFVKKSIHHSRVRDIDDPLTQVERECRKRNARQASLGEDDTKPLNDHL